MVQVPGCKTNFYYFIGAMAVLSILGSTSRVGNVLVALRCVEVRDKALSFAIQVSQWSKVSKKFCGHFTIDNIPPPCGKCNGSFKDLLLSTIFPQNFVDTFIVEVSPI